MRNLLIWFRLDQHDSNAEQQRESDISKSVDLIELLCQDQVRIKQNIRYNFDKEIIFLFKVLDLSMDLRTVKHFMWKGGGDLVLCFRTKS